MSIKNRRRILALIFLGLPYCIIYLTGLPRATGRAAALGLYVLLVPLLSLWFCVNPRLQVFDPDGRLAEPRYAGTAKAVEIFFRLFCLGFAIIFIRLITLPCVGDIYGLWRGERPVAVSGPVRRNLARADLGPLIQYMTSDNGHYDLLFSIEPCLKPGVEVELLVLPRSKLVLECGHLPREAQR